SARAGAAGDDSAIKYWRRGPRARVGPWSNMTTQSGRNVDHSCGLPDLRRIAALNRRGSSTAIRTRPIATTRPATTRLISRHSRTGSLRQGMPEQRASNERYPHGARQQPVHDVRKILPKRQLLAIVHVEGDQHEEI